MTSSVKYSIFKGLKSNNKLEEIITIPSFIFVVILLIEIIISSNKVDDLPSGSTLGIGVNNLPKMEYWGILLEYPPLWITNILKSFNFFSKFFMYFITVKVDPPDPALSLFSSDITINFVRFGKNSFL